MLHPRSWSFTNSRNPRGGMAEEGRTGGWREGAVGLSGDPGSATVTVDDVTSDQALVIRDPTDGLFRCEWAGNDPLMVAYHDDEWGVPCHDDRDLFERLILEVPGRSLVVDDPAQAPGVHPCIRRLRSGDRR